MKVPSPYGHQNGSCSGWINAANDQFPNLSMNKSQKQQSSRTPRRMGKVVRRGENIQSMFSATRTNGPNDPPSIAETLQTTVRYIYNPSTTGTFAFTPQDLLRNVPGNVATGAAGSPLVYFNKIRLVKVSAYALGTGTGTSQPHVRVAFTDDPRTFADNGVLGASAGNVHVRPPLSLLQRWFDSSDVTTKLFNVAATGTTPELLIHVTAEVTSNSTAR
jgi:hypothetical protein